MVYSHGNLEHEGQGDDALTPINDIADNTA
jgi:hypothetical protein